MSLLAGNLLLCLSVHAADAIKANAGLPLDISLTLDGGFSSRDIVLGGRERGFALGHTELGASGNIDNRFRGQAAVALHRHEGKTELEVEEAYIETLGLPAGLQIRGGRFLAQIGYLNSQHVHADDFRERPLLYRAFLGQHYFDDGMRLNWVAPSDFLVQLGAEAFSGKTLNHTNSTRERIGTYTLNARLGGDLGRSQSWQFGLSWLRNQLQGEMKGTHDHHHDHAEGVAGEAHTHGASYTGRNLYLVDGVWKWAPDGNNRERQLRVSGEYARVTGLNKFASSADVHNAAYLSLVYRWHPQWEAGIRADALKVREPHDDHFHAGQLEERSVMLAYKPSHFSTLRLQLTQQQDRGGFAQASNTISLNYVMSLGAHGAHGF
ncbi:hypothetical protein CSQ89_00735 [Chitinimonas sp. BJB300]|nr:hypothetical protein CSQ89_00735 [Chitinimonas sp. BJB300]TSJ90176.1 hypothetical protein FG002_005955 [Chitinimonas sp. BJB300]